MNGPAFDGAVLAGLKRMISASRAEQVLTLYLEQAPLRMTAVEDGLREQDFGRVGRALHDMKSSAGMVGARELERLALEMERDLSTEDRSALGAKVQRLARAVREAQRWISEQRAGN